MIRSLKGDFIYGAELYKSPEYQSIKTNENIFISPKKTLTGEGFKEIIQHPDSLNFLIQNGEMNYLEDKVVHTSNLSAKSNQTAS